MLVGARADVPAVGEHDLGGDEVVDRHPVAPALVRDAAAQREAGDAGLGHDAARRGEPERRRDAIDVGPRGAALHVHGAARSRRSGRRASPTGRSRGRRRRRRCRRRCGRRRGRPAAGRARRRSGSPSATSSASAQRAIRAGRLSIMPFQTRRAVVVVGVIRRDDLAARGARPGERGGGRRDLNAHGTPPSRRSARPPSRQRESCARAATARRGCPARSSGPGRRRSAAAGRIPTRPASA